MPRLWGRRERAWRQAEALKDALHKRPFDNAAVLEPAPSDPAHYSHRHPVLAGAVFL